MCMLFGVTADKKMLVNDYLTTFFSHSEIHRNGWGLALLDDGLVSVEKEPVKASDSQYLRNRMTGRIESSRMFAHIRRATIGEVSFCNTHPFYAKDSTGRVWVLMHNGTIFDAPHLRPYQYRQEGTTDSERLLLYIVDQVNIRIKSWADPDAFNENHRIELIESIIQKTVPGNKLNIMIYDGEFVYVHKNQERTLFIKEEPGSVIFSTRPLEADGWTEVPQNQLFVYKDGQLVYSGRKHEHPFIPDKEKYRLLFLDSAGL